MTIYKRRQTDTVEALQFTSETGESVRRVSHGVAHPGLGHSEHSGYSYHGQRVCFGDYLVGNTVVERAAFEKLWEPATVEPIALAVPASRREDEAPVPPLPQMVAQRGEQAREERKQRGKRTEPGE